MIGVKDFAELIRVRQWYKNIVIFISLIFSFNLFNPKLFFLTFLGFIALCFVSSAGYIINDILDIKKDRYHPEKKYRPLVSEKIKISSALTISLIILDLSFLIAYFISIPFLLAVLLLFLFLQAYNLLGRNVAFMDLIFISSNFVIRAVSGRFIINYPVSTWIVLSTFFISLFLVSGKRSAEVSLKNINEYRSNFKKTHKKSLEFLSIISITCVFIFFSIYSIMLDRPLLLLSLPVALYVSLLFFHTIENNPQEARNPEKFIFNKKILLAILLWLIIVIITFYYYRV